MVKKVFIPLMTALTAMAQNTTLATVLADPAILKLVNASKGGFSGEDSFIEIDGKKVARKCAMLGVYFSHDNTDKAISFFYKNGSYMIGGEVTKANARKQWEMDREDQEQTLEDQMLEGEINPKEWKEQVTELHKITFEWEIAEDDKADLIETFGGFPTEEAFIEAYNSEDGIIPFADYATEIKELRDQAPQRETADEA